MDARIILWVWEESGKINEKNLLKDIRYGKMQLLEVPEPQIIEKQGRALIYAYSAFMLFLRCSFLDSWCLYPALDRSLVWSGMAALALFIY